MASITAQATTTQPLTKSPDRPNRIINEDYPHDVLNIMLEESEANNKYLSHFIFIIVHSNSVVRCCSENSHHFSCLYSCHSGNKTIPMEEYKRLLQVSVELQKMKMINQKLDKALNKKHADFRNLQKKFHRYQNTEDTNENSSVSAKN